MIDSGARKKFKADARKILYKDWLIHILVHLLVIVCFSGLVSLGAQLTLMAYSFGIDEFKSTLFFAFYDVAALFLTVPLCYGVLYFEMQCCEGKKPCTTDVFVAFSSFEKLMYSYELFFSLAIRVVPWFIPAAAMRIYTKYFYVEGTFVPLLDVDGIDEIFFLQSTAFLFLLFFGLLMSSKYFVGVYASMKRPEVPKREAFYIGNVCCHNNYAGITALFLSFVPLFLISLFTVGILFVLYTVPYFLLTFMNMAKHLYDSEMEHGTTMNIVYNSNNGDAE